MIFLLIVVLLAVGSQVGTDSAVNVEAPESTQVALEPAKDEASEKADAS